MQNDGTIPALPRSPAGAPAAPPAPRRNPIARAWGFSARLARARRDTLRRMSADRLTSMAFERPQRLLGPVRAARRLLPGRLFLAQAEALLVARARGWAAAAPLFLGLAEPAARAALSGPAAAPLLRSDAVTGAALTLAIPARARPSGLPPETAADLAIYTAVFGRPRPLPPVFGVAERVRFLCFTDQEIAAPGWEIRAPATGAPADPAQAAAWHKIRPEAALAEAAPGAAASLWLDPERALIGNADTLFTRWLLPHDLVVWRHAGRDWRDMAERHLLAGHVPAGAILAQAEVFEATGVPSGRGGADTGMIWRRHGTPAAAALTEAWWRAWAETPGADDLALYRALHGGHRGAHRAGHPEPAPAPPLRPAILPARLGTAGDNVFVVETARRPLRPRPSGSPARPEGRALPVVFLSAAAHAKSASTFLRGRQLSAMVAAHGAGRYEVRFTEAAADVRDAVVVLTKGAMASLTTSEIAALSARNIATIGCWDDIRPDPEKTRAVDAHMTLSHRQTLDLNRIFPETPAFLVTHHVNSQVPAVVPPADRLRTGYFGDSGEYRAPGLDRRSGGPGRHRHPRRQRQLARDAAAVQLPLDRPPHPALGRLEAVPEGLRRGPLRRGGHRHRRRRRRRLLPGRRLSLLCREHGGGGSRDGHRHRRQRLRRPGLAAGARHHGPGGRPLHRRPGLPGVRRDDRGGLRLRFRTRDPCPRSMPEIRTRDSAPEEASP